MDRHNLPNGLVLTKRFIIGEYTQATRNNSKISIYCLMKPLSVSSLVVRGYSPTDFAEKCFLIDRVYQTAKIPSI
jgi:hypothetical protein